MLYYNPNEISFITHPYCYTHKIFDDKELKKIIAYCDALPKIVGEVRGSTEIEGIRKSNIAWVKYQNECKWFYDKLANAIDFLNQTFYQFNLTGFQNYQFTEYTAKDKGKYDWHIDMPLGDNSQPLTRKLSATLLLNDGFEGGQFEFLNVSKKNQPQMLAGSLIVFPSFMVHRVTEVSKGIRNSLVCWCVGPKFK